MMHGQPNIMILPYLPLEVSTLIA